ncbi:MAG: class E sortase [Actinomycetota bacterium]|nr:class E sortase [Actinomycetota bacterium]
MGSHASRLLSLGGLVSIALLAVVMTTAAEVADGLRPPDDTTTTTSAPPAEDTADEHLLDLDQDELVESTTTTTQATTTTAAPDLKTVSLPVPEPLPTNPRGPTSEVQLGRVVIPALGVDQPLQQGMTLTALDRGPSHWPGTAMPGELGNAVIGGHRTTYSRPFRNVDQLKVGDQVQFVMPEATHTYAVTEVEVVTPDAVHIASQTPDYRATLFACHPPGSARFRIVVHLQLVDAAGQPVPAPDVEVDNLQAASLGLAG